MPSEPGARTGPDSAGYDPAAAVDVLDRALALPGGTDLVIGALAGLPYAGHTPARKRMFSTTPEQVQLGQWRFTAAADGRLLAAHVVAGIALSEERVDVDDAGARVAAAIGQYLAEQGVRQWPEVQAVLSGLAAASR